MKFLIYCIFRSQDDECGETPLGVSGQPVTSIASGRLSAAVSRVVPPGLPRDILQVLAYGRAIESFNRSRTIIPMRYGSLLDDEARVRQLLESHRNQYEALLEELDGLVEMGIRALTSDPQRAEAGESPGTPLPLRRRSLSARPEGAGEDAAMSGTDPQIYPFPNSGQAYLLAQWNRYAQRDRLAGKQALVVEKICGPLSGLFVRSKPELSMWTGTCALSLYFLVPRGSVEEFRKTFQGIRLGEHTKLLLSGPWPPYSFTSAASNV